MKSIKAILQGKVVIVGVGNIIKSDDAFGPILVERLKKRGLRAICIDAGTTPENFVGKISEEAPDTIILVDAVHLGREPGEYEVLRKDDIVKSGFTTHDLSPAMFIEQLEDRTHADIYMLGVQPENMTLGEEISDSVKKAIDKIEELIIRSLASPTLRQRLGINSTTHCRNS